MGSHLLLLKKNNRKTIMCFSRNTRWPMTLIGKVLVRNGTRNAVREFRRFPSKSALRRLVIKKKKNVSTEF